MYTVSIPKVFSLVLVNVIKVGAISDYEMLFISISVELRAS